MSEVTNRPGTAPDPPRTRRYRRVEWTILTTLTLAAIPLASAVAGTGLMILAWGWSAFCVGDEGDGCAGAFLVGLPPIALVAGAWIALVHAWRCYRKELPWQEWAKRAAIAAMLLGVPVLLFLAANS